MQVFSIVMIIILSILLLYLLLYTLIGYLCYKASLARKSTGKKLSRLNRKLKKKEEQSDTSWWQTQKIEDLYLQSDDGLKLYGHFIDRNSNITVILIHGYGSCWHQLAEQAKMFYSRGYNVLAVECRAHGKSEGYMVGMGWFDRLDLLKWIDLLVERNNNCKIVLYGVSMGASTVCMTLGEKLPNNVTCAIEDCGFDNVYKEFSYVYHKKLKFTSPAIFKIFTSFVKRARNFDLKEGDACKQLKKSKTPLLLIHGSNDKFVPTEMVYRLAESCASSKEIYICEGATHAESFKLDPQTYQRKVYSFLSKYCS